MKTFKIPYNVTIPFEVEVEAESLEKAKESVSKDYVKEAFSEIVCDIDLSCSIVTNG